MLLEFLALDTVGTVLVWKGGAISFSWLSDKRAQLTEKGRRKEYDRLRESIWKLEVDSGVGLSNDTRDWLVAKYTKTEPKAVVRYERELVKSFNGACEVYCLVCNTKYTPHDDHSGFYRDGSHERKRMMQKFCRTHITGIQEVLDGLQ